MARRLVLCCWALSQQEDEAILQYLQLFGLAEGHIIPVIGRFTEVACDLGSALVRRRFAKIGGLENALASRESPLVPT